MILIIIFDFIQNSSKTNSQRHLAVLVHAGADSGG